MKTKMKQKMTPQLTRLFKNNLIYNSHFLKYTKKYTGATILDVTLIKKKS